MTRMACLMVLSIISLSSSNIIVDAAKSKSGNNGKQTSQLFCGVCEVMINEVERSIADTRENYEVQTRFRVDEKKRIPYARTEFRIMEILENDISDRFNDYGVSPDRGSHGHQVLVKKPAATATPPPPAPVADTTAATTTDTAATASTTNDATPPAASADTASSEAATTTTTKSNIRSSKRLTKEMKRVYSWMLDRYQDDITLSFHRSDPDPFTRLCTEIIGACRPAEASSLPKPKVDL